MVRVVIDSDDEEVGLSLENDDDDGLVHELPAPEDASPADNHTADLGDTLDDGPSTGSTDKLLQEAHGLFLTSTSSPTTTSKPGKRKRKPTSNDDGNDATPFKRPRSDAKDVWDIPSSPQRLAVQPPTSSEIRRRYQQTPTEVATSSTSRHPFELSFDHDDSGVSMEVVNQDEQVQLPHDVHVMIKPPPPPSSLQSKRQRSPEEGGETPSPKKRRSARGPREQDAFEDDDELAIGLPKEAYKPRASRSRRGVSSSARESRADTACDSVEPASSKKKTTRSSRTKKSVAKPETGEDEHFDLHVAQLTEMGFSASQAQRSLLDAGGDLAAATDLLLSGAGGHEGAESRDDQAPLRHPSTAKRATRTRTVVDEDDEEESVHVEEEQERHDNISVPSVASSPAKTPKPSKKTPAKKRGRPKKNAKKGQQVSPKIDLNTDAADEGLAGSVASQQPEESPVKASPKKRGRPKKNQAPKSEEKIVDEQDDEHAPTASTHDEAADAENLGVEPSATEQTKNTAAPAERMEEDQDQASEKENVQPQPDEKAASSTAVTQSEKRKVEKQSPATSTAGSGRVSYRVGLSKRMKIPSLLRTAPR